MYEKYVVQCQELSKEWLALSLLSENSTHPSTPIFREQSECPEGTCPADPMDLGDIENYSSIC